MAKKRRKKKRSRSIQKQVRLTQPPETEEKQPRRIQKESGTRHPSKIVSRRRRVILLVGMCTLLAVLFLILFFGIDAFRNIFIDTESRDELTMGISARRPAFPVFPEKFPDQEIEYSDFVGSDFCMLCHIEKYTLWRNSTHGHAGGEVGSVKIVARFDDQPLQFKDAVVIPSITSKGDCIFTVRQEGLPEQIVKVDAVVGGGHMEGGGTQSFFTKFPDGTLRFLPFDFNKTDDVWFVQLRDLTWVPISKEVSINNLDNWPPNRILGTSDQHSNCQNCHGSQILVEFDSQTLQYQTRYTTLQINCESCHGPGRKHIDLVQTADLDTLTDVGIIVLSTVGKDESLNKCFECHAVKAALTNDFISGEPLDDYFALKFPVVTGNRFFPDGRIRSFAYQINHFFSDCYIDGSMTCVDCHDPHSLAYRDIFWEPLIGKFDDGQCVDCHPSKAKAPELHSYHKPDSPGNVCTSCHMPFLQHPLLGPSVRFARSDHVIPIPRPAFDAQLGIENACQQCHQDKSSDWQQEKTDEWYRKLKPHNPLITNNMKAKKVTDIHEAAALLLNPDAHYPMAQVTGLFDFIKRFMKPNMRSLNQEIIDKLKRLTESSDIDVKALALVALHLSADHKEDIRTFLIEQLQSLEDQEMAVRSRWAIAMDYVGMLFTSNRDYANAIRSHQKSLEIRPSDAYTLVNLGLAYKYSGDLSSAVATFKKAIRIQPNYASSHFQLALIYIDLQQKQKAINALRNVLKYDPHYQNARQMLRQLES